MKKPFIILGLMALVALALFGADLWFTGGELSCEIVTGEGC